MKTYLFILLVFMSLLPYSNVYAAGEFNQLAALQGARRLSWILSPADFAKLFPKDSKVQKQIEAELANKDMSQFVRPLISMPSDLTVELKFPERVVSLDYSQLEKNLLLVNGHPIKLESYKTFLNYKSEVMTILNQKKFSISVGLFPEAKADALDKVMTAAEWVGYYGVVAAEMLTPDFVKKENKKRQEERAKENHLKNYVKDYKVPPRGLYDSRDEDLASNIISAYQNDVNLAVKFAKEHRAADLNYFPETFTCVGGHLSTMNTSYFETDGRKQEFQADMGIGLKKTESGFIYTSILGVVEMDSNYKVVKSTDRSVDKGSDFSAQAPFFKFPQIAERCCAKAGCYEEVKTAFDFQLEGAVKAQKAQSVQ